MFGFLSFIYISNLNNSHWLNFICVCSFISFSAELSGDGVVYRTCHMAGTSYDDDDNDILKVFLCMFQVFSNIRFVVCGIDVIDLTFSIFGN